MPTRPATGLPPNVYEKPLKVYHRDLKRASEDSPFRSFCPKCKTGLLLIYRDNRQRLLKQDRCVACAQRVYYLDEEINGEALVDAMPSLAPSS